MLSCPFFRAASGDHAGDGGKEHDEPESVSSAGDAGIRRHRTDRFHFPSAVYDTAGSLCTGNRSRIRAGAAAGRISSVQSGDGGAAAFSVRRAGRIFCTGRIHHASAECKRRELYSSDALQSGIHQPRISAAAERIYSAPGHISSAGEQRISERVSAATARIPDPAWLPDTAGIPKPAGNLSDTARRI